MENFVAEKLDESGIILNEQEKFFFVNSNSEIVTYTNNNGIKTYNFEKEEKRNICIETFLAFYSLEIEQFDANNLENTLPLYLLFNGDRELYDAMIDPSKYKDKLIWNYNGGTEENQDKTYLSMVESLKDIKKPFTGVIIRVNKLDEDSLLYIYPIKIRPFELYAEVPLPWIINKYNQQLIVYLSRFQKDLFFDKKNEDENIEVDFYPTDDGVLEPIINDKNIKNKIFQDIIIRLLEYYTKERINIDPKHVIVLNFKNGDKDVLSAWVGTIRYKYHNIVHIDTLKDQPYYDKLLNPDDMISVLIIAYTPGTEIPLYTAFNIYSRE